MSNYNVSGYVACPNACDHCSAPTEMHLGKFSNHMLSIAGHRNSIFGPILSFQDWVRVLTTTPGITIHTEAGSPVAVQDFIDYMNSTSDAVRKRQHDYSTSPTTFLDKEGFTVSTHEFF